MSVARGREEVRAGALRPFVSRGVQGERRKLFSAWVINASGALISRHLFGGGEGGMIGVLAVGLYRQAQGSRVLFGVTGGDK